MSGLSKCEILSEDIQSQANAPAYHYHERLIQDAAAERGGIPLFGRGPVQPFEPLDDPGFFGGVAHSAGQATESNHCHPGQSEAYLPLSGILKVTCQRGTVRKEYVMTPHSILLVPRGVWHHVQWIEPGMAYVFRAPAKGCIEKLIYDPTKKYGF